MYPPPPKPNSMEMIYGGIPDETLCQLQPVMLNYVLRDLT